MILKFADDTIVLGKANSDKDTEIIQQDLHKVVNWSYMWQMPFNTIKCVVMHLGARNARHTYVMENQALDLLQVFKMYKGLSSAKLQHVDTPPRLLNADAIWTLDVSFSPQG